MATYIQQTLRIIDDLGRSDTSITSVVQQHMQDAIRYYQNNRFWFNEGTASISTTVSLAYYSLPSDLIELDTMNILINSRNVQLDPETFQEIDRMDIGGYVGYPILYAEYAEQFRLYPVPNGPYSITLHYLKELSTLSATSDSNAWTSEAENLIRARTIKTLSAFKYKDTALAQTMQIVEDQELQALESRTIRETSSGKLKGDGC